MQKKFILETFFASNSIKIGAIEHAIKNISMWNFMTCMYMICTAVAAVVAAVVETQFRWYGKKSNHYNPFFSHRSFF